MTIQIRHRYTGEVIYSADVETVKEAVEAAVKENASLKFAFLKGADLERANLERAYLKGADLKGAYLKGADFEGADLEGVKGIVSFGPVGNWRRFGYANVRNSAPHVYLGCFAGTLDEACSAISEKYGANSTYEAFVRAACAELMQRYAATKAAEAA